MNLPNYITLFRILLVPFFFTALASYEPGMEHQRWTALAIFLTACLTDALDGFLARVTHQQSSLGRFLDPFADKLLILSGFLALLGVETLPYRPPLWVTVTIVFRDLVLIFGIVILFLVSGDVHIQPNLLGKLTTGFQMATLISIMAALKISAVLWYLTAALTILSLLTYLVRESKRLGRGS